VKIYPASKAKHAPWWRALRACGLPIEATWPDWPLNEPGAPAPTADDWRAHWDNCITGAAAADVLLFVDQVDETAKGALVELGAALARGRRVFMVSDRDWSFRHHPLVTSFKTLADAVRALTRAAKEWGDLAHAAPDATRNKPLT
jgi:hypothetical protein